jgi:hypothetical protein
VLDGGAGLVTFKVTPMVCGLPERPGAMTVAVPLKLPGDVNPDTSTERTNEVPEVLRGPVAGAI